MSDLLQTLLTEPHAALAGDLDFRKADGTPMVSFIIEDDGDIDVQIATALGRMGIACLIDLVDATCDAPDSYPVVLSPVALVCEVSENTVMNRRGSEYLTLRQVLGMVMDKLHQFTYSSGRVLALSRPAFKSVPPPKGASAAYQIYFETNEVLENTRN